MFISASNIGYSLYSREGTLNKAPKRSSTISRIVSIYSSQSGNKQISKSQAPQQAVEKGYFGQCLEITSESDCVNQYYNALHSGVTDCPELEIVRLLNWVKVKNLATRCRGLPVTTAQSLAAETGQPVQV